MRRVLLTAWLALASGCFYVPTIADCAVACTDACPAGLSCVDGLCTRDPTKACECQVGVSRACGSGVGECREGRQTCSTGTWGPCLGEVAGTAEVCDGLDNDCDGLVDQLGKQVLFEGHPRDWRLLSLDGGFALVTSESLNDAGDEQVVVRRLGPNFEPLDTVTARTGPPPTLMDTAAKGSTVYLAWALDGGLEAVSLEGTQRTGFVALEDAGVTDRLRLAVDEKVVMHFDRPGQLATWLGRWSLDGQLEDLTELSALVDSGVPLADGYASGLSDRGHYAFFTATPPPDAGFDDGTLRVLVDTRTLSVLRVNAPYYQYLTFPSKPLELPSGELPIVYTYVETASSWSGIYVNPDALRLATANELTVEETMSNSLAWSSSDAVVDAEGRVSFVYMDNVERRLVLARAGPLANSTPVTQVVPRAEGFGVPHLAYSGVPPFLGLAWADATRIEARLLCPAR